MSMQHLAPLLPLIAALSSLCPAPLHAQLLAFGQTSGRGSHSAMLAGSWQQDGGFGRVSPSVTYVKGVTDRADLYLSAGETADGHARQSWGGIGGNVHVRRVNGFDTSLYTTASFALTSRSRACTLLLNPAVIASRTLTDRLTLYGGVSALLPIGHRNDGVFTPTDDQLSVPFGLGISTGSWTVYGEIAFGRTRGIGVGIERSLPRR